MLLRHVLLSSYFTILKQRDILLFGPGSRPIGPIWARVPAHWTHLGLGPGPFGPIGPGSRPIWAHWAWVPAHLGPLGPGPGPLGPFYILNSGLDSGLI